MKKITFLSFLIIAQLNLNAQDITNTIFSNPGFEDGVNNGWALTIANSGEATLQASGSDDAAEGSIAALVDVTAVDGIWEMWLESELIDATSLAGEELKFEFKSKKVSADVNIQKVLLRVEADGVNITAGGGPNGSECWYAGEDVYQNFERTVTVPNGTTQLQVKIWLGQNIGQVFLDDFKVVNTALSTDEFSLNGLKVYPNPTSGMLQFDAEQMVQSVELFDVMGKVVKEVKERSSMDIQDLSPGIYFARIQFDDNRVATHKIIKR